jgi:CYTH domain-containing protein
MPIRKTRYCLVDDAHAYEVDFYPSWQEKAMLQVELNDPDAEIQIPENFRVIREVTDDPDYQNYAMARNRFNRMR